MDFIDELVPPSGSSSRIPATPEDEGDWTPGHLPGHAPSGPDAEVVVHDGETLDPDDVGPVDIILVDETRSAVVHPTIPDAGNDISANGENSTPTFIIPPRTPSIDLLAHHHKHASKRRSRASQFSLAPNGTVSSTHTGFTSFHTPASSFSDFGEPYESAPSSPLARSRSPSPPPHALRPRLTRATSTLSTSTAPTITPARYATAHALARTTQRRPPRGPKLFFTSAKTGVGVPEVFAYVAQRVVMRWEWEEARAEGTSTAGNGSAVHLGDHRSAQRKTLRAACCSS